MANKRLMEIKPEFIPLYSIFSDGTFLVLVGAIVVMIFDETIGDFGDIFSFGFWLFTLFFIALVVGICLLKAFLFYKSTQYTIFDDRIELKQGILNTTFTSIKLKNIREVHLSENFLQKLCSLGTIKFITSANDSVGTGVRMVDIKYPDRAYQRIKALIYNETVEKEG